MSKKNSTYCTLKFILIVLLAIAVFPSTQIKAQQQYLVTDYSQYQSLLKRFSNILGTWTISLGKDAYLNLTIDENSITERKKISKDTHRVKHVGYYQFGWIEYGYGSENEYFIQTFYPDGLSNKFRIDEYGVYGWDRSPFKKVKSKDTTKSTTQKQHNEPYTEHNSTHPIGLDATTGSNPQIEITPEFKQAVSKYRCILPFQEGLAAVRRNGKWGFINTHGEEVIPCIYQDSFNYFSDDPKYGFSNGFAIVARESDNELKYGLINNLGEEIVPCHYDDVNFFNDGLAAVRKNDKWGFVNTDGIEVISCTYSEVSDFSEGLAAVRKNGKWGFVNTTGKLVIPCKYDNAKPFSEGLAAIMKIYKKGKHETQKWGYINKKGGLKIPIRITADDVGDFHEGLAWVNIHNNENTDWEATYYHYYINKNGDKVFKTCVLNLGDYWKMTMNYIWFIDDHLWNLLDFKNGKCYIMGEDGTWWMYDKNGNVVKNVKIPTNDYEYFTTCSSVTEDILDGGVPYFIGLVDKDGNDTFSEEIKFLTNEKLLENINWIYGTWQTDLGDGSYMTIKITGTGDWISNEHTIEKTIHEPHKDPITTINEVQLHYDVTDDNYVLNFQDEFDNAKDISYRVDFFNQKIFRMDGTEFKKVTDSNIDSQKQTPPRKVGILGNAKGSVPPPPRSRKKSIEIP